MGDVIIVRCSAAPQPKSGIEILINPDVNPENIYNLLHQESRRYFIHLILVFRCITQSLVRSLQKKVCNRHYCKLLSE